MKLELRRFRFVVLAHALLACIALPHSAAAQATSQTQPQPTQPACPPSATSTDQGAAAATASAASTVTKAANSISSIGSIFGKKKPAQTADKVADVAGGCDAKVNAAAADAGTVVAAAKTAGSAANSSSATPAATPAAAPTAAPSSSAAAQPASAPAQGATSAPGQSTQIPAAPAGGIDPSKLPDIQGIHLGMSPDDLISKLKVLYPGKGGPSNYGLNIANVQYIHAPDKPWVGSVIATLDCSNGSCGSDQFRVTFSAPPSKQVAVYLQRIIGFAGGKFPTQQTLIAALIQKYGPNPIIPTPAYPGILTWAFDEQGQPLVPAPAKNKAAGSCVTGTILSPANSMDRYIGGIFPLCQADVNGLVTKKCALGVYVVADLGQGNGGVVPSMTVTVIENSEDLRDAIAGQQYLDRVAAAQQQQQLKNSQQQSVPKL
jgi:hypothetical protein